MLSLTDILATMQLGIVTASPISRYPISLCKMYTTIDGKSFVPTSAILESEATSQRVSAPDSLHVHDRNLLTDALYGPSISTLSRVCGRCGLAAPAMGQSERRYWFPPWRRTMEPRSQIRTKLPDVYVQRRQ